MGELKVMKKVGLWDIIIEIQFGKRNQGLATDNLGHCFDVKFGPGIRFL